jgi:hypothetical protein
MHAYMLKQCILSDASLISAKNFSRYRKLWACSHGGQKGYLMQTLDPLPTEINAQR